MSNGSGTDGFGDFVEILARYKKVITWVTASAVILPLAAEAAAITPPWPRGVVLLTALLQVCIAAVTFQIMHGASRKNVSTALIISFAGLMIVSFLYLAAFSQLTFLGGPAQERLIKGLACAPDALRIYTDNCPFLNEVQIRSEEFTERLWTVGSITASRLILFALWCLSFGAFSFMLMAFIVFQSKQRSTLKGPQTVDTSDQ